MSVGGSLSTSRPSERAPAASARPCATRLRGVPLSLATDDGLVALTREAEVLAAAQQQLERMRAVAYDRSDVVVPDVTILNDLSALCRAEFRGCAPTAERSADLP